MQGWHARKGGERPLVALVDGQLRELTIPVELDLSAGEHTLSATLGVSESFGWGITLSAPETVRWLA